MKKCKLCGCIFTPIASKTANFCPEHSYNFGVFETENFKVNTTYTEFQLAPKTVIGFLDSEPIEKLISELNKIKEVFEDDFTISYKNGGVLTTLIKNT